MANEIVPDYIKEYIIKSNQFMENQVKLLEKMEDGVTKRAEENLKAQERWQNVIETMNQNFIAHNVNIENQYKSVCVALQTMADESKLFRADTWEWAKGLITKIVLVALAVIGTVLGIANIPGV